MARRDNTGVISKNKNKTRDNQPDIRGSCTIDGVEYWAAGWLKTGSDGVFYSLAFTEKEEDNAPARPRIEDSDDIPF